MSNIDIRTVYEHKGDFGKGRVSYILVGANVPLPSDGMHSRGCVGIAIDPATGDDFLGDVARVSLISGLTRDEVRTAVDEALREYSAAQTDAA